MQAKQGFFVLKLIPFIDMQDEYFKFIVDLMEIVSLISFGLDSLQEKIANHLTNFKELFPEQELRNMNSQVFGHLPASEEEKNILQQKSRLYGMLPSVSFETSESENN